MIGTPRSPFKISLASSLFWKKSINLAASSLCAEFFAILSICEERKGIPDSPSAFLRGGLINRISMSSGAPDKISVNWLLDRKTIAASLSLTA